MVDYLASRGDMVVIRLDGRMGVVHHDILAGPGSPLVGELPYRETHLDLAVGISEFFMGLIVIIAIAILLGMRYQQYVGQLGDGKIADAPEKISWRRRLFRGTLGIDKDSFKGMGS